MLLIEHEQRINLVSSGSKERTPRSLAAHASCCAEFNPACAISAARSTARALF
jgi:hypothetical protein